MSTSGTTSAQPSTSVPPLRQRGGVGVFSDNRKKPIHRWYPFIEGYSADLVHRALDTVGDARAVFDPFGGSGTTALAASSRGIDCYFTEVNPYLSWVAHVKVNVSREAAGDVEGLEALRSLSADLIGKSAARECPEHPLVIADTRRGYFPHGVAASVATMLDDIDATLEGWQRDLARMAVASSLVPASNMIRRTDLRRRTKSDPRPMALSTLALTRLQEMIDDCKRAGPQLLTRASQIGYDARGPYDDHPPFDLVVTSPPYLNGTNYCRNSKLELLALGFIDSESGLEHLRWRSITAGINNVSKRLLAPAFIADVEAVAEEVEQKTYDGRIAPMIRSYFSDMQAALLQLRRSASAGIELWLDIGDSRYSGVHVPTHALLQTIAEANGWVTVGAEVLRRRKSYDGTDLTQQLLRFRLG